jgi:hypothetical protein
MDQFARIKRPTHNPTCADLVTMAEHELAAFFAAATELFGSHQARISAEDWLHELRTLSILPASAHEWRLLTIKVVTRLARRVKTADETASRVRGTVLS